MSKIAHGTAAGHLKYKCSCRDCISAAREHLAKPVGEREPIGEYQCLKCGRYGDSDTCPACGWKAIRPLFR